MPGDIISHTSPYIPSIIERLQRIQPRRVILFGSYAYGQPHKNSDIDDYEYVLFAAHGILPEEVNQITQPAITGHCSVVP